MNYIYLKTTISFDECE